MRANCEPVPGWEKIGAKENAPAGADANSENKDVDFASAFCAADQVRNIVAEIVEASEAAWRRQRAGLEPVELDMKGEYLAVFRDGMALYRATWAREVRLNFERLTGQHLADFEDALVHLAEILHESGALPTPVLGLLGREARDE